MRRRRIVTTDRPTQASALVGIRRFAHAVFVVAEDLPRAWVPFECGDHVLEYSAFVTRVVERLPGMPSRQRSTPITLVVVRKVGADNGPGMVFAEGTIPTVERAREAARVFAEELG